MQAFSYLVEPFKYHVFLSFRGKDTRFTFTGNLYRALRDRGFCVFMDDQRIDKGEKISQELPKAIEESRIYIIVLSENFASSRYCLVEVVMILDEFAKGKGRWIVPVFFYVDPPVLVRTYEPALANQKKWSSDDKIEEWRTALTKLSKFPGFCVSRYSISPILFFSSLFLLFFLVKKNAFDLIVYLCSHSSSKLLFIVQGREYI